MRQSAATGRKILSLLLSTFNVRTLRTTSTDNEGKSRLEVLKTDKLYRKLSLLAFKKPEGSMKVADEMWSISIWTPLAMLCIPYHPRRTSLKP